MVLQSVSRLSDDVVVIDSGSTDQTQELCEKHGARWISAEWKGYSENKNLGNSLALHPWILSIDSDEVVSPELADSIRHRFAKPLIDVAFRLRFLSVYCGKKIYYGGWNPEYHIRLFHKERGRWKIAEVHEMLELDQPTHIETLEGRILHHSFPTEKRHLEKMEVYATLFAAREYKQGRNISSAFLYLKLAFQFMKEYLLKLGILDGAMGWRVAVMNLKYTALKYRKLQQLHAHSGS